MLERVEEVREFAPRHQYQTQPSRLRPPQRLYRRFVDAAVNGDGFVVVGRKRQVSHSISSPDDSPDRRRPLIVRLHDLFPEAEAASESVLISSTPRVRR